MSDPSSDNAVVFHDQEVRHRGIGESLLLSVSARIELVGFSRHILQRLFLLCLHHCGKASVRIAIERGHETYRMATFVF